MQQGLRQLIDNARQQVAQTANATITVLYWRLGKRIYQEVLQEQRAEYGEEIVSTLSTQLVQEYGKSFGLRSLRRMIQFAELFPDESVVVCPSSKKFLDLIATRPGCRARPGCVTACSFLYFLPSFLFLGWSYGYFIFLPFQICLGVA